MSYAREKALTSADDDRVHHQAAQVGAAHGERVPDRRLTQRNGYRERRWDTRVGTIELPIPKLRDGSYFVNLGPSTRR